MTIGKTNNRIKKINNGFTLIEILVSVVILGILSGILGKFFFGGIWQEHRVSVQKYYLQREAQYAMDFIINGTMKGEPGSRTGGIIGSSDVDIDHNTNVFGGDEILLYGINRTITGRILAYPSNGPTSLVFDESEQGTRRTIIPYQGDLDAAFREPYNVIINFYKDPNFNQGTNRRSLVYIDLRLQQTVLGRDIFVEMHSAVGLRNTTENL